MSECATCHNTGKVTCPECNGEKTVKCEKCNGKGQFKNCITCNSTGEVECTFCNGTGKSFDRCPVCEGNNQGKVRKSRLINCDNCYGKGYTGCDSHGYRDRCRECGGKGQVEDFYYEICPNCHGVKWLENGKKCSHCDGTGKEKCSRCGGTGHAKCKNCGGTGKAKCSKCGGEGKIKCPDCAKREKAKQTLEEQKRKLEEKRRREAAEKERVSTSPKKRWKFVVLGLLFGFLGLHLAYAKRWFLFLLLWAGFIAGGVFYKGSAPANSPETTDQQVQQTEQAKPNDDMIGGIGFGVWALLWIGGTLFIKKDGKGNRM